MPRTNNILAPLDVDHLQNEGLAGPVDESGFVRLHKRRLFSSSDREHGDLPLTGLHDPDMAHAFATIPEQLCSLQTLQHIGLATWRAEQLWDMWTNWPATGPQRAMTSDDNEGDSHGGLTVTFLDFILGHILPLGVRHVDNRDNDDSWWQCLEKCGIESSLKEAIMDVRFRCIREADSCGFWLRDTISMRYAGLEEIKRASQHRAASAPASRRQQSLSSMQTQQAAEHGISDRRWSRGTAAAVANKPGHLVLYKALDQGRLAGFWRDGGGGNRRTSTNNGNSDDDHGNWRVEKLLSFPPTDFSGQQALFSFTPDARVAEYYAAYAKRRAAVESVVMVAISIKQSDLAELEDPATPGRVLRLDYPSPEWKQIIWRSKNARSFTRPLNKYRDALLLIGTTTKGAQCVFEDMQSWEDIRAEYLLRVPEGNSNPAIQYVFNGDDGGDFLRRKGWFEVFPLSNAEVDAIVLAAE